MSVNTRNELEIRMNEAISRDDAKTIKCLVKDENLDVNVRDIAHDLLTILMKMCYLEIPVMEVVTIIQEILDRDPDVNIQDSLGRTAVMHACISGRSEIADCLISDPDTLLEKFDFDGNSALYYAVQSGCVNIVKRILEHPNGVSLINVYNCNGETPVTIAEKDKNTKIQRLLSSYQKNSLNQTADGLNKRKKHQNRSPNLPPTFSPRCEKSFRKKDRETHDRLSTTMPAGYMYTDSEAGTTPRLGRYLSQENKYGSSERISVNFNPALSKDDCKQFNSCEKLTGNGNENVSSAFVLNKKGSRRESFRSSEGLNEISSTKLNLPAILLHRKEKNHYINSQNEEKLSSRMKERRNSWSLPDLRDMPGCLVASGDNTPQHGNSKDNLEQEISDEEEDNVFTSTKEIQKQPKVFRKCKSEIKIKFPSIQVTRTLTDACVFSSTNK